MIEYKPFHDRTSFAASVSALFGEHAPVDERMEVVRRITDDYYAMLGEFPQPGQLSRLGSFILRESDGNRAKHAKGHLTRWQIEYREKRELPLDPARYSKSTEHKLYGTRAVVPVEVNR